MTSAMRARVPGVVFSGRTCNLPIGYRLELLVNFGNLAPAL